MIHSIRIKIPDNIDNESLIASIESLFIQNNFKVDRNGDKLTFERITSKKTNKIQVILELFKAMTIGTIYFDNVSQKELICKIYYFKQLAVSLVVGIVISLIFALYAGSFWSLLLKLGLPITLVLFVAGIVAGNSQIEKLLRKAIV